MLRIHVIALFSYRLFIASNVYCPCPPRGLFFVSCNRESGNGKGNPPSPSHPPLRPATHIPCFCIKVARGLICRMIKITGGLKPSDTVIFSHTGEEQSKIGASRMNMLTIFVVRIQCSIVLSYCLSSQGELLLAAFKEIPLIT